MTQEDQVQSGVDTVVKEFNGRLDIFVANAGAFPEGGGLVDIDITNCKNCIAANLDSTIYCARASGRHFRRQKIEGVDMKGKKLQDYTYGKFVATASVAAGYFMELPDLVASYSIAKAGVVQLCIRPTSPECYSFTYPLCRQVVSNRMDSVRPSQ